MLSVDQKQSDATIVVRDSMNKFSYEGASLDVEVVDVFDHPRPMYLNQPLIMILETLGVPIQSFVDLQKAAITLVTTSAHDMKSSAKLFTDYGLGASFRIPSVLLGLARRGILQPPLENEFLKRALNYGVNDVLRSLKHKARIYIPNSWTLVGVADTHKYLREGEIFGTKEKLVAYTKF